MVQILKRLFLLTFILPIIAAGAQTLPIGNGGTGADTNTLAVSNLFGNPSIGSFVINCTSSTFCTVTAVPPSLPAIATNGSGTPIAATAAGIAGLFSGGSPSCPFLTYNGGCSSSSATMPNAAYLGGSGGVAVAVSPNNRGFDAVLDLGLPACNTSGCTDNASALQTIENYSTPCAGTTTTNCVPSKIIWPAGVFEITQAHFTGTGWRDQIWQCAGNASNFPAAGHTIFYLKPSAGGDGLWFDPPSAVFGSPRFQGCVFVNGNVTTYNASSNSWTYTSNADITRSLVHFSNVNDIDEDSIGFEYGVGTRYNPNGVNGAPLPTSGDPCSVTNGSYTVTCTLTTSPPSGTTVGYFPQGFFLINDVGGTGRPYQQEIYYATLSGTTLTMYLATPYQHKTNSSLYVWEILYNNHGFLIDGRGQVFSANGGYCTTACTGNVAGYSQYASTIRGLWSYCSYNPLDFSGGGVQHSLSAGGSIVQSLDLYGTSRITVDGGWLDGSCGSSVNPAAPNNYLADGLGIFVGGFTDTTIIRDVAGNKWAFGIVSENASHSRYDGQWEDTGTLVYSTACNSALGSGSVNPAGICSVGVTVGGDLTAGSHALSNEIGGYILGFGRGIEILPTARQTEVNALIPGNDGMTTIPGGTPGLINYIDIQFPQVGDPNCGSVTTCYGLSGTTVLMGGNIQKWTYLNVAPSGACALPGQYVLYVDGTLYVCAPNTMTWVHIS